MNSAVSAIVTIATAILGVAILAVIVSRNANTAGVIKSAGDAFGGVLGIALSPVSGAYGGFTPTM